MSAPFADQPPPFPEPPTPDASLGEFELPAGLAASQATVLATPGGDAEPRRVSELSAKPPGVRRRRSLWSVLVAWWSSVDWWAWFGSTAFHVLLLVGLSLLILAPRDDAPPTSDDFGPAALEHMELEMSAEEPLDMPVESGEPSLGPFGSDNEISLPGERASTVGNVRQGETNAGSYVPAGSPELTDAPLAPVGDVAAGSFDSTLAALSNPLASRGGGLEGRTLKNRYGLALSGGGSRESEAAVEAGLAWLAEHQLKSGGWHFDLEHKCPQCAGYCRNSGNHTSTTAATGLALLSFLGAGYTHKDGKYQEVVSRGIYYLHEHMIVTSRGGDLRDINAALEAEARVSLGARLQLSDARRDSMYSHGIATLALTEAYAMTRDKAMRKPAEEAVKFIVNAQYDDGGWRYAPSWENPGPGDTTVTGWQLMALKSALLAGIDVPYEVWIKASAFLDRLQDEGGAKYNYVVGERGTAATTAIGLLCRMIGGWPRDHRPLQKGAAAIGALVPSQQNMYFNYYASQVLHHLGGRTWERWNPNMRDYLVNSQATEGHEKGSWYFAEPHSTPGGRLYTTAMAVMTLEVYYRYIPIYKEAFVDRAP